MPDDNFTTEGSAFPPISAEEIKRLIDHSRSITEAHRENLAYLFLDAGIHLIPSDLLKDNQFVVSTAVYEAAKRICRREPTDA